MSLLNCEPYTLGKTIEQRFWEKVDIKNENDCWNWMGCLNKGYGAFTSIRKTVLAYKQAYIFKNGPIPERTYILHKCNNKKCCNPSHLYIGNQRDNLNDSFNAGVLIRNKINGRLQRPNEVL